ncbi:MAG TPA: CDF family Co(II)/Ni(II) efflux transporter DmeF [Acetobacteraceae bacterium]|nr:CDF family Co(II)/Ni(II) efflux transporter DmeF [Acetobacteraceae bacterium]
MNDITPVAGHSHVFLGEGHDANERRTWAVIWLCGAMMVAEIIGGLLFGSIALVADGLHMSTHAGALLLAALAYRFARRHAQDTRFAFGTGKFGDLAGFASAIVLAMIALLIGYEAVSRFLAPVPIHFSEAIPIAALGLIVNVASVWLLGGGHHHHGHGHGHGHHDPESRVVQTTRGALALEIFEDGVPPRFRLRPPASGTLAATDVTVETERQGGVRQVFALADRGGFWESEAEIPEPHEFTAHIRLADASGAEDHAVAFEEHAHHPHGAADRDNNMRAAVIHVLADAAVSVLVITGLSLGSLFGWVWMDPLAGMIGAVVIASWSYGLIRDTGRILLDMTPDAGLAEKMRRAIEGEGDHLSDLHLWRLGPGHLGAIVAVRTASGHGADHYRGLLARFPSLSHVTIEVQRVEC